MPMDRNRYPRDWEKIAHSIKQAADWRCKHCDRQCLRPQSDTSELTRAEKARHTLTVHHADYTPENNHPENLIPLCAPCHLKAHSRKKGNIAIGQLALDLKFDSPITHQ